MKTCYVSMPFGIKPDPISGMPIDFDRVYHEAVKPAAEAAGLTCVRADELVGALIQKSLLTAVLGSEVMIADITTTNPNVMYELGIRHAAQSRITVLIKGGQQQIPFDIGYAKTVVYQLDNNGQLTAQEALALRQTLTAALRAGLDHAMVDSPVYEFFPDFQVTLPESLAGSESRRRTSPKRKRSRSSRAADRVAAEPRDAILRAENEALSSGDTDPITFINLLKAYRDISAWDDVIRLADQLPPQIQQHPEVRQLLALALNRRAKGEDQNRAIAVVTNLINETGGDGESYGILGRIYKDRYVASRNPADLDDAIRSYREGFEKEPTNYYPGVNVVTLLLQKTDVAAQAELQSFLPRVQEAVNNKMKDGLTGYWELATATHLACVAKDWQQAHDFAERALDQSPSRWMLQSTIRDLESLERSLDEASAEQVRQLVMFLRSEGADEEVQSAQH